MSPSEHGHATCDMCGACKRSDVYHATGRYYLRYSYRWNRAPVEWPYHSCLGSAKNREAKSVCSAVRKHKGLCTIAHASFNVDRLRQVHRVRMHPVIWLLLSWHISDRENTTCTFFYSMSAVSLFPHLNPSPRGPATTRLPTGTRSDGNGTIGMPIDQLHTVACV